MTLDDEIMAAHVQHILGHVKEGCVGCSSFMEAVRSILSTPEGVAAAMNLRERIMPPREPGP